MTESYGPGNRIQSFGATPYVPDLNGSVVADTHVTAQGMTGRLYTWDALGRLRVIRTGTGTLIDTLFYDALGRRVRKVMASGAEHYVYEGDQIILDVASDGTVKREYAWYPGAIDRLLAMRTVSPSDTFAALLDDRTGTVRGLLRFRTGIKVKDYAEAPWGDAVADTGLVVRYRFAGREFDQESGLYYMGARYYDPAIGRWLSEDPVGVAGGSNLYAYSGNDPVNNTDPFGNTYIRSDGATCQDYVTVKWQIENGQVVSGKIVDSWTTCEGGRGDMMGGGETPVAGNKGQPKPDGEGGSEKDCTGVWADAVIGGALDIVGAGLIRRAAHFGHLAGRAAFRAAYAGRYGRYGSMLGERIAGQAFRSEQAAYGAAAHFGGAASTALGAAFDGYGALDAVQDVAGLLPGLGGFISAGIGVGKAIACSRSN